MTLHFSFSLGSPSRSYMSCLPSDSGHALPFLFYASSIVLYMFCIPKRPWPPLGAHVLPPRTSGFPIIIDVLHPPNRNRRTKRGRKGSEYICTWLGLGSKKGKCHLILLKVDFWGGSLVLTFMSEVGRVHVRGRQSHPGNFAG